MAKIDIGENLDSTFEVSLDDVKARAVRGVVAIMGRGFFIAFVAQISQFFLLAFMDEFQMGTFWIVSAAVGFFVFFTDIGLAAALIQKSSKPSEAELKTTFTIQQGLIGVCLLAVFLLSPYFQRVYGLSNEGVYLLYAMAFSLFLASLKSIPSVLLERKLEFGRFIIPDLLETLTYSIFVVVFAWQGLGIMSFTYAVLLRGIVGVVTIYILQPWRPGIFFSWKALKGLFAFGIPYQINTVVSVLKDRGTTLVLGASVGTGGIGFLGAAERVSQLPLRQFMDPVTKVTFPAFARMQGHKEELAHSLTRSLLIISFFAFPATAGIVLVTPVLVNSIANYQKWQPALTPLIFMGASVLFASITTQLMNTLMALGKMATVTKLNIMWTVLTLMFIPALGYFYGINGAAAGYALVSATSVIAIVIARRYVGFSLRESILKTGIATLLMSLVVYFAKMMLSTSVVSAFILIALGVASYILFSFALIGRSLLDDGKKFAKAFINK